MPGSLFAISDLHISWTANQRIVDELRPESRDDWLIVAGDVGETFADIEKVLQLLRRRYANVIWTPGNHELWTHDRDPVQLRATLATMPSYRCVEETTSSHPRTSSQSGPVRPVR